MFRVCTLEMEWSKNEIITPVLIIAEHFSLLPVSGIKDPNK